MRFYKMYHYTNESGFKSIKRSKKIVVSSGFGDAVFGTGVYLTEYSPWDYDWGEIANNNWGGGYTDRCKYVIEVYLPDTKLSKKRENVWLFSEEVDLNMYRVKFINYSSGTPYIDESTENGEEGSCVVL